jgi:hypothetical protein
MNFNIAGFLKRRPLDTGGRRVNARHQAQDGFDDPACWQAALTQASTLDRPFGVRYPFSRSHQHFQFS